MGTVVVNNDAPSNPSTPSGPNSRDVGVSGDYSTSATDSGEQVQYRFDWDANGAHSYSSWTSLVPSGTSSSLSHSWGSAGTYVVKAQAMDQYGKISGWSSGLTVTVNEVLVLECDADGPYTGTMCSPIQFTGSASNGVTPYSWSWTFGDGGTSSVQNPTHQYAANGVYIVTLTVADSLGASDSDTTSATITTVSVVAAAHGPYTGTMCSPVQFTGSATGGCGAPYSYSWTFGDGGTSSVQNPSHQYAADGTYPVTLTVTDGVGASDSDTTSATITTVSVVAAAHGLYTGTMCSPVQFTGSATGGCTPYYYSWTFGDGGTSSVQNPTHQYAANGVYIVTLTVADSLGASDSDTTTATVTTAPVVCDAGGPYSGYTNIPVQFAGTATGGCTPYSYSWTFGDGGTSTAQNPSHPYTIAGTYTVSLIVTDSTGALCSDTATATITIPPLACNVYGPYHGGITNPVSFVGLATGGTPPYSWSWTFGDGGTSTAQNPSHPYTIPGNYTVSLTVTDSTGATCSDTTIAVIIDDSQSSQEPPTTFLMYPTGGETLAGIVTVQYFVHDSQDEHWSELPIYLYYLDEENNFALIYQGTKGPQYDHNFVGTYEWDTTTLPDGTYKLLFETIDSDSNIGSDQSDFFQINNHGTSLPNNPPNTPNRPSGSTNGKAGVEYTYMSSTSDPEGDQIWLLFDWGDNTNSGWLGPYNSGATCQANHTWNTKGNYNIKVKAKDIYGKESSWSDSLPIIMPYSYNPILQFLERLLERFPNAFPMLRQLLG
jgi:PKD repeat protein